MDVAEATHARSVSCCENGEGTESPVHVAVDELHPAARRNDDFSLLTCTRPLQVSG